MMYYLFLRRTLLPAIAAFFAMTAAGCQRCREDSHQPPPPPQSAECEGRSACGARHYCSDDHKCICVESAEGVLRRGRIPDTCHVKLCKSSADCAELGPGYFCDTPNSGCCTDPPKELARCVAPYHAAPPPVTSASLTGAWEGATDSPGALETPVRLQLVQQGTRLSGKVLVASSGTTEFIEIDEVHGSRAGDAVALTSTGGLTIEAKLTSNQLVGTVHFPGIDHRSFDQPDSTDDVPPYVARLRLRAR